MKKYTADIFILVFAMHLLSILFNMQDWRMVTKPLILAALILHYIVQMKSTDQKPGLIVIAALLFSLAGDVLLMFEQKHSLNFILGLSAFLLAHICYIVYFFQQLRLLQTIRWNKALNLATMLYGAGLLIVLWGHLGDLKIPVTVYALTICSMCILALQLWKQPGFTGGAVLALGAVLFVVSDSFLALDRFYSSFSQAPFLIMLSYGLAQYLLVSGIIFRSSRLENA